MVCRKCAWLVVVLAVVGVGLAGCSGSRSSSTQPALVPDRGSPIVDVPVPAGFSLRTDKDSWHHVAGPNKQRLVHHVYRGADNYQAVARFYKDQLPKLGWTYLSELTIGDTTTLRFTKNAEPATITVQDGTFHTYITIQINLDNG